MSCNILLQTGGRITLNDNSGFLLLTNCIVEPLLNNGGALQWYYNGWSTSKKKKADKLINRLVSVIEDAVFLSQELVSSPEYVEQKEIIAHNIIKEMDIEDLFRHHEIQAAIERAEKYYYENLAKLQDEDDAAAILLLLN